jgi:hypothetical protein
MPSSRVDLPVPFSPTKMVIAFSKTSSNPSASRGSEKGYLEGSATLALSSNMRLR